MTGRKRWFVLLPLLLLAVSAAAVHQHAGPGQEATCLPDPSEASQEVNRLDVEELIAEYAVAVHAAQAALEGFLAEHGIDRETRQQTKTRMALEYFAARER